MTFATCTEGTESPVSFIMSLMMVGKKKWMYSCISTECLFKVGELTRKY